MLYRFENIVLDYYFSKEFDLFNYLQNN